MARMSQLPQTVASTTLPIALTIGGAFLLRRALGAAISVFAMFAVGRMLLTALKVDLALAERRHARNRQG
jgi:hypothetical protein